MGGAASVPEEEGTTQQTQVTEEGTSEFFGKATTLEFENEVARDRFGKILPSLKEKMHGPQSPTRESMARLLRKQCAGEGLGVKIDDSDAARRVKIGELQPDATLASSAPTASPLTDSDVAGIVQLLKSHEASWTKDVKQVIVSFVDGSERGHWAYIVAKKLLRKDRDDDELGVITVESEKAYLGSNYKVDAIRTKYESELTGFLPSKRWRFLALPKSEQKETRDVVRDFVNCRDTFSHPDIKAHPDPTFVVVGFSGRKSSEDRDPTVIGQVADLSLRAIYCPCIVVKLPEIKDKNRHYVMLVDQDRRCLTALKTLGNLLAPDDKLTLLHAHDGRITTDPATDKAKIQDMYASFAARCSGIDYIDFDPSKWAPAHERILNELQDSDRFKDVDFVCVACRPRNVLGNISDNLVKHYAGNVIIIKTGPT